MTEPTEEEMEQAGWIVDSASHSLGYSGHELRKRIAAALHAHAEAVRDERARAEAIESRAREVLRTGEETERKLAEARRELDQSKDAFRLLHARTNCACHTGEEYVEGSVCQDCLGAVTEHVAALEADLAAMRGASGAAREKLIAEHSNWPTHDGWAMCKCPTARVIRDLPDSLALASSPGAAWLATAREVVEALEDLTRLLERLTPEALWSEKDRARALLARSEVQEIRGMKGTP